MENNHAKEKTILAWSSGKDSSWALHELRRQPEIEVVALLTSLNQTVARVSMHAVRETLLETQAAAAGLDLIKVNLPDPCSHEDYDRVMNEAMERAAAAGITRMAFGDLFLEDIRRYREERLAGTGIEAIFPLWGRPTAQLAQEMVTAGLRAHVTCVDPKQLDPAFVGRTFDADFLADLPAEVDPCGERGEFHTFAYAGPMFGKPIAIQSGEVVTHGGFVFADVFSPNQQTG